MVFKNYYTEKNLNFQLEMKENIEKWIVICNFGHAEKDLERPFLKFSSAILTVEDQTVDLFLKDDRWF